MQHLARAHCEKRRTYHVRTYVPRTYASSTVSRHFGAETKSHGHAGIIMWNMYRLFPWPAGYKTRYIPRERTVLEWSRGSAEGEARGTSEAERKHWPLPRDVTGLTSRWPGIQLTYGYSKVSTLCRHRYCGVGTHRSVAEASVTLEVAVKARVLG